MAIGNIRTNLTKIGHVVPETYSRTDRQADKQVHTRSSQYSAIPTGGGGANIGGHRSVKGSENTRGA